MQLAFIEEQYIHDLDPSGAGNGTPLLWGRRGGKSIFVLQIVNICVDDFIENCAFFLKLSLFLVESAIDYYLLGFLECLLIQVTLEN